MFLTQFAAEEAVFTPHVVSQRREAARSRAAASGAAMLEQGTERSVHRAVLEEHAGAALLSELVRADARELALATREHNLKEERARRRLRKTLYHLNIICRDGRFGKKVKFHLKN